MAKLRSNFKNTVVSLANKPFEVRWAGYWTLVLHILEHTPDTLEQFNRVILEQEERLAEAEDRPTIARLLGDERATLNREMHETVMQLLAPMLEADGTLEERVELAKERRRIRRDILPHSQKAEGSGAYETYVLMLDYATAFASASTSAFRTADVPQPMGKAKQPKSAANTNVKPARKADATAAKGHSEMLAQQTLAPAASAAGVVAETVLPAATVAVRSDRDAAAAIDGEAERAPDPQATTATGAPRAPDPAVSMRARPPYRTDLVMLVVAVVFVVAAAAGGFLYRQQSLLLTSVQLDVERLREETLRETEALRKQLSDSIAAKTDVVAAIRDLGALAGLGDPKRARQAYARALEFEPDNSEALYWHGWLHLQAGLLSTAETSLSRLLAVSKSSNDKAGLYRAHLRLGAMELERGSLDAARKHTDAAFDLANERTQEEPVDQEHQRRLAEAHMAVGDVLLAQGNLAGALKSYRDSVTISEGYAAANAEHEGWQEVLEGGYQRLGNVRNVQRDYSAALKSYNDSLAIAEQRSSAAPANAGWRYKLSSARIRVGNVQLAQGDPATALVSYNQGVAGMEHLVQTDPQNLNWQRDLTVAYTKVGDVHIVQTDPDSAIGYYRNSAQIRERLAASDPTNYALQAALAASYGKLGVLYVKMNRSPEALEMFKRGRAIVAPLADETGNARWKRYLAAFERDIAALKQ